MLKWPKSTFLATARMIDKLLITVHNLNNIFDAISEGIL